jgi:arsenate reductase
MAEGLLGQAAGATWEVFSAGTKPTRVRPEAIAVMGETGIDISGHHSKSVEEFLGQDFDYVITVCDNARETCPVFPARTRRFHWSIEDPAAVEGGDEERMDAFRHARDELQRRLRAFVREQTTGAEAGPSDM